MPSNDLRALDASVDADPLQAISAARGLIHEAAPMDYLRHAELHSIIADAFDTLSDDLAARAAVADGRRSLAPMDPSPQVRNLQLRLELVEADTAQSESELDAAVKSLNGREPTLGETSLERACLLLVRSRMQGRLNRHDLAAKDGMLAHQLAVANGSGDAAAEAAYQLGTTFRRAGLYEEALRLEDEVIAYSRATHQRAVLASGLWAKAQILGAMSKPEQALPVLDESQSLSAQLNDQTGLAFGHHERCYELLRLNRIDEAEQACAAAERIFSAAGRLDQRALVLDLLAKIDLARNRPREALSRLTIALDNDGANVPPTHQPRVYRDLAEALARVGRVPDALAAAQKAMLLTEQADQQRRSVAVAVLNAQRKSAIEAQARAALALELATERDRAASRELARRLTIGLAVAGVLVSLLCSYLLVLSRRHARELRRQEAILRETSMNAPDALALLDAKGMVRFANRSLFGVGDVPGVNRPLSDAAPVEARQQVVAAVAELIENRRAVSIDIRIGAADDARYFELRGNPILDGERLIGATLRLGDVTEIRTLEREVLAVASEERERLSSDLHEGVGQELTGVSLLLRGAATAVDRGHPNVRTLLADSIMQVDRTIAATCDLARGLSPVQVDQGSLSIALERLALDASHRLDVRVTSTSHPPDIRLSDDVSNHLYRIAHEAVTNAAGRGDCTQVSVELVEEESNLRLSVASDGAGPPCSDAAAEEFGSRTMGYRARLLGGTMKVKSNPGAGARVVVSIPRANLQHGMKAGQKFLMDFAGTAPEHRASLGE